MTAQRSALQTQSAAAEEYLAITGGAAIFDASHHGRLKATGDDALDLLNRLSTSKVIDLQPGQGCPDNTDHRPRTHPGPDYGPQHR